MNQINRIIAGLQIFAKYAPDAEVAAEHDVILVGCERALISEEDSQKLADNRWYWDSSYDCYRMFV